jgi:CheY-like chemotaxis protein
MATAAPGAAATLQSPAALRASATRSMPASRKASWLSAVMPSETAFDIVVPRGLSRSARSVPRGGARSGRRADTHERATLSRGESAARLPGAARGAAGAKGLGATESIAVTARVVIADDSPSYLELLVVVLGQMPQLEVVGTAADGCSAVRIAVEREADVVLLDVEMPGLDGFGAAEEIRRLRPQTNLVLHTGMLVDDRRRRAEELNLRVLDKLELTRTIELVARSAYARRRPADDASLERQSGVRP